MVFQNLTIWGITRFSATGENWFLFFEYFFWKIILILKYTKKKVTHNIKNLRGLVNFWSIKKVFRSNHCSLAGFFQATLHSKSDTIFMREYLKIDSLFSSVWNCWVAPYQDFEWYHLICMSLHIFGRINFYHLQITSFIHVYGCKPLHHYTENQFLQCTKKMK